MYLIGSNNYDYKQTPNYVKIDKIIFGIKTTEHVDSILVNSRKDALDNSLIKKLRDLYENDFGLIDESRYEY